MSDSDIARVMVQCPCCGARLKIDPTLGKVIAHETARPTHKKSPDLDRASRLLERQAARREALFKHSAEEEKIKSQLLERKFAEALEKSKDQFLTPPMREIDLD